MIIIDIYLYHKSPLRVVILSSIKYTRIYYGKTYKRGSSRGNFTHNSLAMYLKTFKYVACFFFYFFDNFGRHRFVGH